LVGGSAAEERAGLVDAAGEGDGGVGDRSRTHDRQYSSFVYNARDMATQIKNGKTASDPGMKTTTYTYTSRAQVDIETKANGNTVDTDYFLDGLVKHSIEKKPNGAVVNEQTVTYDANSHRLTDVVHKQNADNNTAYLDTTSTFAYDPLDRIRSVTKTGSGAGNESYVHAANSNVIQQTAGVSTTFTYDRNRLVSSVAGGVTASYQYDPYGRLQRVTTGGVDIEKYVYDGFDRTVSHTTVAGGTTTFKYDPLDRQVQRTHAGKTTDFTYLGLSSKVLTEEEGGQLKKLYQYRPGGRLLAQIKINTDGSEEPSYYGFDSHSSIDEITDQQGDARATYGYTAYGKNDDAQFAGVDKPDSANPGDPNKEPYNSFRYKSKRYDQATGDYDMGFRDYDPGLNRFLTRDAYNGALSDMNLTTDP
jgi:RHS repeat-associated protein